MLNGGAGQHPCGTCQTQLIFPMIPSIYGGGHWSPRIPAPLDRPVGSLGAPLAQVAKSAPWPKRRSEGAAPFDKLRTEGRRNEDCRALPKGGLTHVALWVRVVRGAKPQAAENACNRGRVGGVWRDGVS